jgi:UDP-N-acetyl-D-mannosaminuronate dehydrogenase
VVGHPRVDLAGQLHEPGRHVEFPRLPGEVELVERLAAAVDRTGRAFSGASVLVLGLAYKRNVEDSTNRAGTSNSRAFQAR